MIWFWSDLHIEHDGAIEMNGRPFPNLTAMHAALASNYKRRVRPGDTVYWVGDISFGSFEETDAVLGQMRDPRVLWVLVQGNHDKHSQEQYRKLGFSVVVQECTLRMFGRWLLVSHYPYRPTWWRRLLRRNRRALRYLDRRPLEAGRFLIHGHTHSKKRLHARRRMVHVGVDCREFTPVSQREIESEIALAEQLPGFTTVCLLKALNLIQPPRGVAPCV